MYLKLIVEILCYVTILHEHWNAVVKNNKIKNGMTFIFW